MPRPARLRTALVALVAVCLVRPGGAQVRSPSTGTPAPAVPTAPETPEPEASATGVEVTPIERWVRHERLVWDGTPIELHLRTGYARPLIMPEPVAIEDREPMPGVAIELELDVVLFEPAAHLAPSSLTLVGERTGTRYALRVRSSVYGERIPVEVSLPER